MEKQSIKHKVLGMMSGTSFDGIDLCLVDFLKKESKWEFNILHTKTEPYPDELKSKILEIETGNGIDLIELDFKYGHFLGKLATNFLEETNSEADLIASHGHTIFHQIEKGVTYQLGNGASIAAASNITTVSDFRSLDVALGGEGAPLVPFGDLHLFSQYDYCLNIGGIANVSFQRNNARLAFDIAPANMVLNALFQSCSSNGEYDNNGKLGRSGSFDQNLFDQLNQLKYYSKPYPKSIGKEWVIDNIFPILNQSKVAKLDQLNTYYKHLAHQITRNIRDNQSSVFITGGGAKNTYLIDLLKGEKIRVIIPPPTIIDYKEALIFAFLGLNRFLENINTLKSVTGASRDSSGGTVFLS